MIDLEQLLEPIAGASPSGFDPTSDSRFEAIQSAIENSSEEAPPDWKKLRTEIVDLLNDGRSLDLLIYLAAALAATDGWEGVRDGLELLDRSVRDYWDSLHPELDLEEPEDERYDIRLNTLAQIGEPPRKVGDHLGYVEKLLRAPLSSTNRSAPAYWPAWEAAQGTGDAAEASVVKDYLTRCSESDRLQLKEWVDGSLAALERLNAFLIEQTGSSFNGPFDEHFLPVIREVSNFVERGIAEGASDSADNAGGAATESAAPTATVAKTTQNNAGIGSSDDVRRALTRVIEYYGRTEPSSPIPHILERALKLVDADFMTIVKNLNQDAEFQFRTTLDLPENSE